MILPLTWMNVFTCPEFQVALIWWLGLLVWGFEALVLAEGWQVALNTEELPPNSTAVVWGSAT